MYKTRAEDGINNISGINIKKIRQSQRPRMTQKKLAELLQLNGMDCDKNTIQRIECGKRFITDIEIKIISKVLRVSYQDLIDG